jgi:hypothetical protein
VRGRGKEAWLKPIAGIYSQLVEESDFGLKAIIKAVNNLNA